MSFRVALCYPLSEAVTVMPPLGIGYLASVSEQAGFPTDLFDLSRRHLKLEAFFDTIAKGDYRVVGLSVSTPNYRNVLSLISRVRRASPESLVVIGGPHPSSFVETSLRESGADYLVQREGEHVFVGLLQALKAGSDPEETVPGVFALRNGRLVGRPNNQFVDDLDQIPWPAWDKIEPQRYPLMPHQFFVKRFPVAPVLTTRGCPMDCSFCASGYLFGHKIRTRNPEDVVEEMRHLRDRFGVREIHFEDDNMTLAREHSLALFDALARADLGLATKFPNGLMTMTLDEEVLDGLAGASCYQISLGIETTSKDALDKESKYIPYQEVREVVANAKKRGIDVQGLFVVGLPYDKEKHVKQTVRDAIRLGLDLAHFGVYVPLPGSAGGEKLASCEISSINFFTPHISYDHFSPRKLKSLQRWAILRFYLRPRPIWKLLSLLKWRQVPGFFHIVRKYIFGI